MQAMDCLEKSVEALKRMEDHGCALTVSAYNSLIDVLSEEDKHELYTGIEVPTLAC